MRWKEYTLYTTVEAEELAAAVLLELGVEGIEIEDNIPPAEAELEAMFIDLQPELAPETQPADGTARLKFFLREPEEEAEAEALRQERARAGEAEAPDTVGPEAPPAGDDSYVIADRIWLPEEIDLLLTELREALEALREYADVGEGRIQVRETRDTDWRNNWKQFYKPVLLDGLLICPEWEDIPEEYRAAVAEGSIRVIRIEPGTAFGTGTHESTKLCVDGLRRFVKGGEALLDIGTGSGILGLCALSLGASRVFATELDPACEAVLERNLALNGIGPERFALRMGDILRDEALRQEAGTGYDLVTANILAPVITALAAPGQADRFLKEGGIFIASGIIGTKEAEVRAAFAANPLWEGIEVLRRGDWIGIMAGKRREGTVPVEK